MVALCASKAHHRLSSEGVSWCLKTSVFLRLLSWDVLPGEFHGQRSLEGCSPHGCKESGTTDHTYTRAHTQYTSKFLFHLIHYYAFGI